jgi:hypothetical protein
MKKTFIILLFLCAIKTYSQVEFAEKNYLKLKNIISSENSLTELKVKLDSMKMTFKDKRNNYVDYFLNRSIDFDYNHNRIRVFFELYEYQIDLITKNDSIYLKSLKTEYFKKFTFKTLNENKLKTYINLRNQFYNSKKNTKDLIKEISQNETYAMYCGDGLPITEEGIKLTKIVKVKNINALENILSNFNCENQSFAVLGFNMLIEKEIEISKEILKKIEHIKNRNSELQVCKGCITGIIEKIY